MATAARDLIWEASQTGDFGAVKKLSSESPICSLLGSHFGASTAVKVDYDNAFYEAKRASGGWGSRILFALGRFHANRWEMGLALGAARASLTLYDSGDVGVNRKEILHLMAYIEVMTGRPEKATEALHLARLEPIADLTRIQQVYAHFAESAVLKLTGDTATALAEAERAASKAGAFSDGVMLSMQANVLGHALAGEGHYKEAAAAFRESAGAAQRENFAGRTAGALVAEGEVLLAAGDESGERLLLAGLVGAIQSGHLFALKNGYQTLATRFARTGDHDGARNALRLSKAYGEKLTPEFILPVAERAENRFLIEFA